MAKRVVWQHSDEFKAKEYWKSRGHVYAKDASIKLRNVLNKIGKKPRLPRKLKKQMKNETN